MKKRIAILGGGLAGMSTAYHLNTNDFTATIFEKSHSVGGMARTIHIEGFTFDFAIHLLHLHNEYTKQLIAQLLKDNVYTGIRNAAIYIYKKLIPYPFQVHTFGLPQQVIDDCLIGFRKAVEQYGDQQCRSTTLPFDEWSTRTFGQGITKHFMKPYNEKFWKVKSNEMTAEWCGMFVPQPKLEDVENGAKNASDKQFGYNTTFLYPKQGGIQVLSQALSKGLDIKLNTALENVDWKNKEVTLSNGEKYHYHHLVSSIPLRELLIRMKDLPENIAELIPQLKWTPILCINLGIDREHISDKSWIYFPEKKYIFYRIGFPMNFAPHSVPAGCSSMYVEISHSLNKPINWTKPGFLKRVRQDLEKANILHTSDIIKVVHFLPIHYAYVIYTPERKDLLEKIFAFLNEQNIFCVGRYGEWKYSYMEEAILDGKRVAEKIMAR